MNYLSHIYTYAKKLQEARQAANKEYNDRMKALSAYVGSKGYAEDAEKAANKRDKAINEVKDLYVKELRFGLERMRQNIAKRPLTPPKPENMMLIQALQSREKITRDEFKQAANTCEGDPVSLGLLTELYHKYGYMDVLATDIPVSNADALNFIDGLSSGGMDFAEYGTSRASRMYSEYLYNHYGTPKQERERTPFTTEEQCYSELCPWLDVRKLDRYAEVVNDDR
jgi:hypothetical protein